MSGATSARSRYGDGYTGSIIFAALPLSALLRGVGKSTLAIIEGIAMASGRALLGVDVSEQVKVWYWNGEEPQHEIARRVHATKLAGPSPKSVSIS
jgi:hypothetical protein